MKCEKNSDIYLKDNSTPANNMAWLAVSCHKMSWDNHFICGEWLPVFFSAKYLLSSTCTSRFLSFPSCPTTDTSLVVL